ncbi:MAG: thiamine pyrophosphate-binding protein [Verrucomicrobia bacterium]|nr:thiamine pyrophosphate-binding protein [Verrucomicrobiota bacterium]
MIKLSDYVMKFVAAQKVEHVFLLPGGGCMHLLDSLGRRKDIRHTCCLHEQAAVIAAEAYAQHRQELGVALVTTGPGGLNAITGVAGAWIDSTPVLVLSGQVKRADMIGSSGVRQMGIQEADIVSIVKPITKYAVTITDPKTVRYHLEKAVHIARSGRPGPVWLDFPLDVQGAMIDEDSLAGFDPAELKEHYAPANLEQLAGRAIEMLNRAARPVLLAGNGIRLAGAIPEFMEFIEALQIPVLTTWKSIDLLPEDDPYYFGRPGSIASRGANFIQQNSDLLIVIGARLDLPQTAHDHANFARAAEKIIVDIDPAELGKMKTRVSLPVPADARVFLTEFLRQAASVMPVDRSGWLARCREWKRKYPVVLPEYGKSSGPVNTYCLVDVLSNVMKADDVLVPGSSGACAEITMQAFRVRKGQRIQNTPGLGSMGFGLPASFGACLASGGRRTIGIIGEGGLQHNIQELETLARLKLPIKLFVLNNNGYGSIRATQNRHFAGRLVCCDPSSGLTLPDTCKVAAAYGLKTARISNQANLEMDVKKVLETEGTVICDVVVDPDLQTAPRIATEVRPDGSIVSKPMEDLWPFLDREEFRSNMLIEPLKE